MNEINEQIKIMTEACGGKLNPSQLLQKQNEILMNECVRFSLANKELKKENNELSGKNGSLYKMWEENEKIIDKAEFMIIHNSQIGGDHHKAWVLDQVMRITKGDKYDNFVRHYEYSEIPGKIGTEKIYSWDEGISP